MHGQIFAQRLPSLENLFGLIGGQSHDGFPGKHGADRHAHQTETDQEYRRKPAHAALLVGRLGLRLEGPCGTEQILKSGELSLLLQLRGIGILLVARPVAPA